MFFVIGSFCPYTSSEKAPNEARHTVNCGAGTNSCGANTKGHEPAPGSSRVGRLRIWAFKSF